MKNPVTFVLYSHVPFSNPYRTTNVSVPVYGPQLRETLVGLILLELMMIGTVVTKSSTQGATLYDVFVDDDVELVVVVVHVGFVIVVLLSVTAPVLAKNLPWTVEPPLSVIATSAIMVPTNVELVPSVAELVTCQKTLHACAPLISEMVLDEAVMSVEGAKNINTALASPSASSVNVPLKFADVASLNV